MSGKRAIPFFGRYVEFAPTGALLSSLIFALIYFVKSDADVCLDDPITLYISSYMPDLSGVIQASPTHSPLYFLLVRPIAEFGLTGLRLFSAMFIIGTIFVVHHAAFELTKRKIAGFLASFVFAVWPSTTDFLACGRPYAAETFFAAVAFALLVKAYRRPTYRALIGLSATSGIMVHFSVIAVPTAAAFIALGHVVAGRTNARQIASLIAPFILLVLPLVLFRVIPLFLYHSDIPQDVGRDANHFSANALISPFGAVPAFLADIMILLVCCSVAFAAVKARQAPLKEAMALLMLMLAQPVTLIVISEYLRQSGSPQSWLLMNPQYKGLSTVFAAVALSYFSMSLKFSARAIVASFIIVGLTSTFLFRTAPGAVVPYNSITGFYMSARNPAYEYVAEQDPSDAPVIVMSDYPFGDTWRHYGEETHRVHIASGAYLSSSLDFDRIIPAPGQGFANGFSDSDGRPWLREIESRVDCGEQVWLIPRITMESGVTALEAHHLLGFADSSQLGLYQELIGNTWPQKMLISADFQLKQAHGMKKPGETALLFERKCE